MDMSLWGPISEELTKRIKELGIEANMLTNHVSGSLKDDLVYKISSGLQQIILEVGYEVGSGDYDMFYRYRPKYYIVGKKTHYDIADPSFMESLINELAHSK